MEAVKADVVAVTVTFTVIVISTVPFCFTWIVCVPVEAPVQPGIMATPKPMPAVLFVDVRLVAFCTVGVIVNHDGRAPPPTAVKVMASGAFAAGAAVAFKVKLVAAAGPVAVLQVTAIGGTAVSRLACIVDWAAARASKAKNALGP